VPVEGREGLEWTMALIVTIANSVHDWEELAVGNGAPGSHVLVSAEDPLFWLFMLFSV